MRSIARDKRLRIMRRGHQVCIVPSQSSWHPARTPLPGIAPNVTVGQCLADVFALRTTDLWRKMSIYIVIPALCIAGVNAWRLWSEHWEHKAHEPPVEERTEYPYMNIRTKNFFWGDGDKVSHLPPLKRATEGVKLWWMLSQDRRSANECQTLFWNTNVNYHKKEEP